MATKKSKVVYLVLFIIFLIGLGFFWLDYIGLIKLDRMFTNMFHRESPSVLYATDDEPSLIEKEEFQKEKDQLMERVEELDRREAKITEQEKSLEVERDKMDELKVSLDKDRKRFEAEKNRYSGYQKNVKDAAGKIESMPPKDSVAIMIGWEDSFIIDVLRQMDSNASNAGKKSITSYLLSLMPKDRASRIMYLMTQI